MASNVLDEFLILFRTRLTGDGIQKVNKQLGHTRNQLFATRNLFKTFFAYDLYGAFSQLIPSLVETTQKPLIPLCYLFELVRRPFLIG